MPFTGETFTGLFEDPNFLRMLGEAGGRISQGEPLGQALGVPASAMIRRKAAQEAGTDLMRQIMEALRADPTGRDLLGPKEDLGTANRITMTNDGIKLDLPNPSETRLDTLFGGRGAQDEPLESIKSFVEPPREPDVLRGEDLRDFFRPPQF